MSVRVAGVAFDARQPRRLAGFWAELLGWTVLLDRPDLVEVAAPDPAGVDLALTFLAAERPVDPGKNRIHVDLVSRSRAHQELQVDRALALGARRVDIGQGAVPWTVLADPEGNVFCVLEPREQFVDTGAVAAIVVDTVNPVGLAEFWATACGWPVRYRSPATVALRAATDLGAWLAFVRGDDAHGRGSRVHLDLAAFADDHEAELDRLRAAGATAVIPAPRAPHAVLADPEHNEFCLLRAAADYTGV
ncbi:VOC family protein [Nocardia farcinica]|uniref:VOC family protein n=1 Tax=Nocardia farcinica TaxID=37329 RepID=UPI0024581EB4|nr:VOC family protein [Nocardia farcinica]